MTVEELSDKYCDLADKYYALAKDYKKLVIENSEIIKHYGHLVDKLITTKEVTDHLFAKYEKVTNWQYPSEGKLPKDANTVIVSTDQNQVIPGFYDGINWYTAEGLKLGCKVIAWSELPPPVAVSFEENKEITT